MPGHQTLSAPSIERFRKTPLAAAIAAALVPSGSIGLSSPRSPVSGDTTVNQTGLGDQTAAAAAADADGDYVVVWNSGGSAILGRRFDSAGTPLSDEFQVNQPTAVVAPRGGAPAVAMDADGDFVVAWTNAEYDYGFPSGFDRHVAARRYDATGAPQGSEFAVNTFNTGDQQAPRVAMDADGDFIVAWESAGQDGSGLGVFARLFDATGSPRGPEFRVNQVTTGDQGGASVAMDADGDFVAVWTSDAQDGSGLGVFGRAFDSAGTAKAGEFQVSQEAVGNQSNAAVALDDDGDFVVAWDGFYYHYYCSYYGPGDCDYRAIWARRFDAGGKPVTSDFLVAPTTPEASGLVNHPAVAMDAQGDFVVAWQTPALNFLNAYYFNAPAARQVSPFALSACPGNLPAVAMDADGDFVAAWDRSGCGSNGSDVIARRFAGTESVDLNVDMSDSADPVGPGARLSYTVTVTNQHAAPVLSGDPARDAYLGAVGVATGVVATFFPPSGYTGPSASGTGWSCNSLVPVTCRYAAVLAPGESASFAVSLTAAGSGGPSDASVSVSGSQYDADAADDVAVETTLVNAPPANDDGGALSVFTLLGLVLTWVCRLRGAPRA